MIPHTEYLDLTNAIPAPDISRSGTNRFEWTAPHAGLFQLSYAKHVQLYAITVWKNNGHLTLADGTGRIIVRFPSLFTGSFNIIGYAEGGLYANCAGVANIMTPLCVTWLEGES